MPCSNCNKSKKISAIAIVSKAKSIVKGWTEYVINGTNPNEVIRHRLKVCNTCANRVRLINRNIGRLNYYCSLCGCPVETKARSLDEVCERNLW